MKRETLIGIIVFTVIVIGLVALLFVTGADKGSTALQRLFG